jgi:hypothetical protein
MRTAQQAEASRNNGKQSLGPTTLEGKEAASRNSVKFGLFSRQPLLPGEDETAFTAFRAGLLEELRPAGFLENELAERAVSAAWRLRRIPAVEAAIVEWQTWAGLASSSHKQAIELALPPAIRCERADDPEGCQAYLDRERESRQRMASTDLAVGRAFIRDAEGADALSRLCRAEILVSREFYRSLHELRSLQSARSEAARQNEPGEGLTIEPLAA